MDMRVFVAFFDNVQVDTSLTTYILVGYFLLLHVIDFIDLNCALSGDSFL